MNKLINILIEKGFKENEAEQLIRAGYVKVNGEEIILPNIMVKTEADIFIKKEKQYVSRGAYKLLSALKEFEVNVQDKIGLDIGSSTGGFTEILLESGAKKVYSLDVGTNQLDFSLRRNPKVVVLEKTNLKTIIPSMFDETIDIVVTDVSFISLKEVFKVLEHTIDQNVRLIALIKPQYEAYADQVEPGGYVPQSLHEEIINKVKEHARTYGFRYISHKESPIKGNKAKNIEYISMFIKE